ncbi:MAG: TMEM128 family protein [Pontixanthobacter sp.]
MVEIEKLAQRRNSLVLAMAVTFGIWQGSDILAKMLAADSMMSSIWTSATAIGGLAFAVSALLLAMFQRRVKKAGATQTLRDDWNRATSGLAFQYGFFFLIGATALCYAASMFWSLPTAQILQALLLVGVCGTCFAFVTLQGSDNVQP